MYGGSFLHVYMCGSEKLWELNTKWQDLYFYPNRISNASLQTENRLKTLWLWSDPQSITSDIDVGMVIDMYGHEYEYDKWMMWMITVIPIHLENAEYLQNQGSNSSVSVGTSHLS